MFTPAADRAKNQSVKTNNTEWRMLHSGVCEVTVRSDLEYENPYWDVELSADVRPESGEAPSVRVGGFHDGIDGEGAPVFRVRFRPTVPGRWICTIDTRPHDASLSGTVTIDVDGHEIDAHGQLQIAPGDGYRFRRADGSPEFLLGDTMYNLFGAAYSGLDTEQFLDRRAKQGVNYVRVRAQTSPFHPGTPRSSWPVSDFWPWGGSAQKPDLTRFHPPYFAAVDRVFEQASRVGVGFEMILEAWMFEFPFSDRASFDSEIELHWIRYIIARYSAFPQLLIWCPANEYEFFPDGQPKWHRQADRWIARLARAIREIDPYRHPIGVHNWEQKRSLFERLEHVEEIDVFLVQADWGREMALHGDAALCRYVDRDLRFHSGLETVEQPAQSSSPAHDGSGDAGRHAGTPGPTTKAVICAEFGYERSAGCRTLGIFEEFGPEHTRRGQWRAGFSGCPVVHGFDCTWGPHMSLESDSEGSEALPPFRRFLTEIVDFADMVPALQLIPAHSGDRDTGTAPLCMSSRDGRTLCLYFPCAGWCEIPGDARSHSGKTSGAHGGDSGTSDERPHDPWRIELFDPRTGELHPYATPSPDGSTHGAHAHGGDTRDTDTHGADTRDTDGSAGTLRLESPEGSDPSSNPSGEPAPDWIVVMRRQ